MIPLSSNNHSVAVFEHLSDFPADVRQLFIEPEQENLQLGTSWLQNLAATVYPNHSGVRVFVLRRAGQAVAALPVLVKKGFLGWDVEALSNYYTSLYAPALAGDLQCHELALLIKAVLDAHAPVGSFRFSPMDPESTGYSRLEAALRENAIVSFRFFCFGNWYLRVSGSWSNYLTDRSGTLRNTIKRMTKRFSADGGSFELVRGGIELDRGIQAFERVYATSWKQPEPYPDFIPSLITMSAAQNALRLGIAVLHGLPIAAQLWLVANGKAYIYKVAYNEEYKAYAPGTLLTAMLMQHVLDTDQVSEVDFLTGDDPYKKTWMSHRRERWGIIGYNPITLRGMVGLIKEALGRTFGPSLMRITARLRQTGRQTVRPPAHARSVQSAAASSD